MARLKVCKTCGYPRREPNCTNLACHANPAWCLSLAMWREREARHAAEEAELARIRRIRYGS